MTTRRFSRGRSPRRRQRRETTWLRGNATHTTADDDQDFTNMLLGSWAAQGLSFANPVTVLRILLNVTMTLPTASTVTVTFGITKTSAAAANMGVIPDPISLADSRRRWLINNTWQLTDPNIIARVTPQALDLRGKMRLEPNDRLVITTANHAVSTGSINARYSWRALVGLH